MTPTCATCHWKRELEEERRAAVLNLEELEARIEELEYQLAGDYVLPERWEGSE